MIRLRTLLGRPITIHTILADIAGGLGYGAFLNQLLYWADNPTVVERDGWFYKTQAEWYEETRLRRTEQESARKHLIHMGLLEEKLQGQPARLWYRLNVDRLEALLREASMQEPANKIAAPSHASMQVPAYSIQLEQENTTQENTTGKGTPPTPSQPPTPTATALSVVPTPPLPQQPEQPHNVVVLDLTRGGTLGDMRWAFFGKKPATARGSQAPDRVVATEAALEWAQGEGWQAGLPELQRSADTCIRYYQGTGKRHVKWEPVVENWVTGDIRDGKDVQMAERAAGVTALDAQRSDNGTGTGRAPGRAPGPRTGGERRYGYNSAGEPTNRATKLLDASAQLAEYQRERRARLVGEAGEHDAPLGSDDGGGV